MKAHVLKIRFWRFCKYRYIPFKNDDQTCPEMGENKEEKKPIQCHKTKIKFRVLDPFIDPLIVENIFQIVIVVFLKFLIAALFLCFSKKLDSNIECDLISLKNYYVGVIKFYLSNNSRKNSTFPSNYCLQFPRRASTERAP